MSSSVARFPARGRHARLHAALVHSGARQHVPRTLMQPETERQRDRAEWPAEMPRDCSDSDPTSHWFCGVATLEFKA
jgi:hypothetical protein